MEIRVQTSKPPVADRVVAGFHQFVVDYEIELNWMTSGAMQFFIAEVVGIILEDVIRTL